MSNPYTPGFYQRDLNIVVRSARRIVPMLMDLLSPKSVVDVGCGVGSWLSVFAELGVADYQGIDGDYVQRDMLQIPANRFMSYDLSKPLHLPRKFDLAMSVEVAEHLHESAAKDFVRSLTRLSSAVLFSAAIPFQGGAHHVNERWPDYWAKLFADEGYQPIDCIRRHVWQDESVAPWYAQNILLFIDAQFLARPRLKAEHERTCPAALSLVHPRMYMEQHRLQARLNATATDLASFLRPGDRFVLVDEDQLRTVVANGYRTIPFLHREGVYWGNPADDQTAIGELEYERKRGARFIVITWPAFWWLDYYKCFTQHLRERYKPVLENERMIAFALTDSSNH